MIQHIVIKAKLPAGIDIKVIDCIMDLFGASGAQRLDQINEELLDQCVGIDTYEQANEQALVHLAHLEKIRRIHSEESEDDGYIYYGDPSDF